MIGLGPHRLNAPTRPDWFWEKDKYGGILVDIGSHQIEQFLDYAGAHDAQVVHSQVANYHHPEHPEFEDFGDASLVADNGSTFYFRVDWFTPQGLGAWGDGRTIILGTDGYMELRKYLDVARDLESDHVYLVDHRGEQHLPVYGKVGFPYFGQLILDCLNRTENAMTQQRLARDRARPSSPNAGHSRVVTWNGSHGQEGIHEEFTSASVLLRQAKQHIPQTTTTEADSDSGRRLFFRLRLAYFRSRSVELKSAKLPCLPQLVTWHQLPSRRVRSRELRAAVAADRLEPYVARV